jgi:hypothetical protein
MGMGRIKTFFNKLFKHDKILLGDIKASIGDNIEIEIDRYTGELHINGMSNFEYPKEYWFPEDNVKDNVNVKNNIMKTIYYINGQEFYQEDNNLEYFKYSYNKKINIAGKYYIIKTANYNLFEDVLNIGIIPEIRFTYDIFVKNFNEYLIDGLEFIGYTKSDVSGTGKNLVTNAAQAKYYFTDCDYSNGCMGYVCNYNTHALAIAAINNNHDKFQWFQFPFNEYEFCEVENVIEEYGKFEGTEYPKKLTPDEIIKYIEGVNF